MIYLQKVFCSIAIFSFLIFLILLFQIEAKGCHSPMTQWNLFGIIVNCFTKINCQVIRSTKIDISGHIALHWYDTNTKHLRIINLRDVVLFTNHTIDFTRPWYIYIPGFKSSPKSKSSKRMINAFLKAVPFSYFIVIDHSKYTDGNDIAAYNRAVSHTYMIATALKNHFLQSLINLGLSGTNIHMIGSSLGAHIVGMLGRMLMKYGVRLKKCTGLDPAGPCLSSQSTEFQLSKGDCQFVEVIHTNMGQFGTDKILSDFEAIANCAGILQPRCVFKNCYPSSRYLQLALYVFGFRSLYSHRYSVFIYSESILKGLLYTGYKCDSYASFKSGFCKGSPTSEVGFQRNDTKHYYGKYYFLSGDYLCDIPIGD